MRWVIAGWVFLVLLLVGCSPTHVDRVGNEEDREGLEARVRRLERIVEHHSGELDEVAWDRQEGR